MSVYNLCKRFRSYFGYDDHALLVAKSLVRRLGKEQALVESWEHAVRERGGGASEYIQIYRAVRDITKPEMLYHL